MCVCVRVFRTYSREINDSNNKKYISFAFSLTLFERGFQTLHYDNLAFGLPSHTRFDDLDLVAR